MNVRHRRRLWWAIAVVVGAAPPAAGAAQPSRPVLVLPFTTEASQPRIFWLGEGVSMLLTDALRQSRVDVITREERVRAFERLHLPAAGPLSLATAIRTGQVMGASYVVSGALRLDGDELAVTLRAIAVGTGRLLPELEQRGALSAIQQMVAELAGRLARAAPLPAATLPGVGRDLEIPLAAFEQFVKGLIAETPATQVKFLEAAVALRRDYDEARLALAQVHLLTGAYERALEQAQAIDGGSRFGVEARFLAGLAEIQLERYEAAFATLKTLAGEKPAAPVFNNLGVVQLLRGSTPQTGRATYYFNEAAGLAPEDGDYCFNLGYAYLLEQDIPAAIYWLREAVRRNAVDGEAHFLLSIALGRAQATAEARRERDVAARLAPDYADLEQRAKAAPDGVPRERGRLRAELAPARSARLEAEWVRTQQQEQQQLAAFHLDRGRRLFADGRDWEAATELRRSLFLLPYQAEAHLLLGRIALRAGRVREAIDELTMSLWSQETTAGHLALALAYEQQQNREAARREATRVLELTEQAPNSPDSPEQRDRREAEQLLNRLKDRGTSRPCACDRCAPGSGPSSWMHV